MKVLVLGFGTRGDVQPLLPFCRGLMDAGFSVRLGAGTNFRSWIEACGIPFGDIGIDMQKLMAGDAAKAWVENSHNLLVELGHMRAVLARNSTQVGASMLDLARNADLLISNLPTFGIGQALAEKFGKQHIRVMFAPLTPSNHSESTLIPVLGRRPTPLNRISCYAGVYYLYWVNRQAINDFRRQLDLAAWGYRDFLQAWSHMPVLYALSPQLMPRDATWPAHTFVTGYWFDPWAPPYAPEPQLADFLQRHPQPVYLGFGSMATHAPEKLLSALLDALAESNQPGIIDAGWARLNGVSRAQTLPPNVFLVDNVPHAWLFPHMRALIHHGGAGTTATGARAGVPASVVAHMADQPYWGRRLFDLGVGARPIRRKQLSAARLAHAICTMTEHPHIAAQAQELGRAVERERGVANAVQAVQQLVR